MITASLAAADTILCLGAHADDIEIGCGGTLLRWLAERPDRRVEWVVLSAAGERAAEARASATRFLAASRESNVVIRDFRDSFFPDQYADIKSYFQELAAQIRPDVIFTHRLEDRHQDHRLVGELTWNAFRDHLILEYEIHKYEGDLGQPNAFVALTEDQCEHKVNTIVSTFPSQANKYWFSRETLWSLLRIRGIEARAPHGFAEGFTCRKMVLG